MDGNLELGLEQGAVGAHEIGDLHGVDVRPGDFDVEIATGHLTFEDVGVQAADYEIRIRTPHTLGVHLLIHSLFQKI